MRHFSRAIPVLAPLILVAFLLFFGHRIATFYTDWLWFDSVGQPSVFRRIYGARLSLFGAFGAASFFLAYLNLVLADRISPPTPVRAGGELTLYPTRTDRPLGKLVRFLLSFRRTLDLLFLMGALVFAALAGVSAQTQWEAFLRFTYPVAFGQVDPIFGKDLGYYIFTLPFLRYVQGWLLTVLIIVGLGVALIYLYQEGINSASGQTVVLPHVRGHLSALLALILLVKAWGYWFYRYDLMSKNGAFPGAGYTDIHIRLPMLYMILPLTILAALAVGINIWRRSLTLPAVAIGLWLTFSLAGAVIPAITQRLQALPNEAVLEAPYIAHAIAATRAAYDLNAVRIEDFPETEARQERLSRNIPMLSHTRIWGAEPLLEALPQQQGIRQYYVFPHVDVDRYHLSGAYRQVSLAVREIAPESLEGQAQTWPNLFLRFTHGFGAVVSSAEGVRPDGTPEYLLRDVPPVAAAPELALTQPRIYYGVGPGMFQYAVVRTKQPEFDYPTDNGAGGGYKENVYDGRGGVRLTPLAKMAFAIRFATWSLLRSQDIDKNSRLLLVRYAPERIKRLAPFLLLDNDIYPVITKGRLVWVQDAYTITASYPYSAPIQGGDNLSPVGPFNYIRNAVKVTVDAYDGTVLFYVTDDKDPMLRSYRKAFPSLFRPASAMPAYLREHRRYPEDLFAVQRRILRDYHVTDPGSFYNRADTWQLARLRSVSENRDVPLATTPAGDKRDSAPYFALVHLPRATQEEYALLTPFTPHSRENLTALFVARCDGDHYGERILYRFSNSRIVYGPEQVRKRIRADSAIATFFAANDKGGRFLPGSMQILPIESSLLYVQPVYLRADRSDGGDNDRSISQLRQIMAAYGDRIVMEPTLPQIVNALSGLPSPPAPGDAAPDANVAEKNSPSVTAAALIEQANDAYERGQAALRAGDFAAFGQETKTLGDALRRLKTIKEK